MKLFLILILLMASGCGNSSTQNELTGQVKKVVNQTPIFCGNRVDADVSLGVMKNGVGSMSNQDIWFTVPNPADQAILKKAAETSAIVKITYDVARFVICWEDHTVSHVEIAQ